MATATVFLPDAPPGHDWQQWTTDPPPAVGWVQTWRASDPTVIRFLIPGHMPTDFNVAGLWWRPVR